MVKYKITPARKSDESLLKPIIALIDYRSIGTFEDIDAEKLTTLVDSITATSWNGPAISVFKSGGDDTTIENGQVLEASYGAYGVADGHNRLETIRILDTQGLLRTNLIPVQVIPARDQAVVRIITLNPDDELFDTEQIEACFNERNEFLPWSTSHFQARLTDGSWARLRDCQPDLLISKDQLFRS